jgi:hypothetical protein
MAKLGLSGRIAQRFQATEITPLLAPAGLLLGLFAVLVTPREEEPQINVTFADIFIPFPGASASEIEHLVAGPAEQLAPRAAGPTAKTSVSAVLAAPPSCESTNSRYGRRCKRRAPDIPQWNLVR